MPRFSQEHSLEATRASEPARNSVLKRRRLERQPPCRRSQATQGAGRSGAEVVTAAGGEPAVERVDADPRGWGVAGRVATAGAAAAGGRQQTGVDAVAGAAGRVVAVLVGAEWRVAVAVGVLEAAVRRGRGR